MRAFFRQFALGALVMSLTLLVMIMLPHDTYTRWQAVKIEAFARLGWIYERIHYDDTPIDIAFIGTSHTMMGINTQSFEDGLAAAGVRSDDKRCLQVVNLAVPSYGRDLHWIIGRELLKNRHIKTLVLEVFENETRKAHPLFVHVADTDDILEAPILINQNYLHNLVRLPYRQLALAIKSLSPESFGLKTHFDPADYDGSNVDNTRIINVDGAALSPVRDHVMDFHQLEATSKANLAAKNLHMLGDWGQAYEYAVPNHYLTALLDLAKEQGVNVVFLYLPQYGMPPRPVDEHPYQGRGDWIYVNDLLQHPDYWFDEAHLNAQGAAEVTRRVQSEFVSRWQSSEALRDQEKITLANSPTACTDHHYPPRATLKPFHPMQKNAETNEDP